MYLQRTNECTNGQLGIFEGSDAAWENADYHITLEGKQSKAKQTAHFTSSPECLPSHILLLTHILAAALTPTCMSHHPFCSPPSYLQVLHPSSIYLDVSLLSPLS